MNSLGTRLFAAFLAIILLVLLIVSLTLLVLLRNNPLVERLDLTRLHAVLTTAIEQGQVRAGLSDAEARAVVQAIAAANDVRVLVTTSTGETLVDSAAGAPAINFLRFRTARRDAAFPNTFVGRVRDQQRQPWLYVARPGANNRVLVVAAPPKRFSALVFFGQYLFLPLLEAAGVAAAVAVILAVIISRSIAGPLHKMAGVAQAIARGQYEAAAPASGPQEVRALGSALNSMARQVQANQQAQRDFLANVSHELKTPLTSIQGFAQAIVEGAVDTPDGLQRSANIIHAEADRMRRLVDDLLDLARLDAGLQALERAPLDLHGLLAAAVEKAGWRAREAGVTLSADLPASLPPTVGDADRLAQVFANLLDNALKHTPQGGAVTLSAAAGPGSVEVSVTDTGSGIPPEDLSRIFERFYQVDKSRARSGGIGLGLAITRDIVEAHGGSVRVESTVGKGTRFTVSLPAVRPDDSTWAGKR